MSLNATERRQYVEISMKLRETKSDYVVPVLHMHQLRWTGEYAEVDVFEMLSFVHYLTAYPELTTDASKCFKLENLVWNYAHLDTGFPAYHRLFLLLLEREYQKIARKFFGVEDFALPYWEWTNSRICDPCVDDLIGDFSKDYDKTSGAFLYLQRSLLGPRDGRFTV